MARNFVGFRKQLAREVEAGIFYSDVNADEQTCPKCGGYMPFHGGELEYGEGYWRCMNCGFTVKENEIEKYKPDWSDL